MSGVPYPAGVEHVLELLEVEEHLLAEQEQLQKELEILKPKQARLREVESELIRGAEEIGHLLDEMDVSSPGNFGLFLARMRNLILKSRNTDPTDSRKAAP